MSVQEVNSDYQRSWLKAKATAIEWIAVIISSASAVIAIISAFLTIICISIMFSQNNRIEALSVDVGVADNKLRSLEAYMKQKGIPLEEIYE